MLHVASRRAGAAIVAPLTLVMPPVYAQGDERVVDRADVISLTDPSRGRGGLSQAGRAVFNTSRQ